MPPAPTEQLLPRAARGGATPRLAPGRPVQRHRLWDWRADPGRPAVCIPGQASASNRRPIPFDSSGHAAPKRRTRKLNFPAELDTDRPAGAQAEGVRRPSTPSLPTPAPLLPSRGRTPASARPGPPPLGRGEAGPQTSPRRGSGRERARGGGGERVPEVGSPGP